MDQLLVTMKMVALSPNTILKTVSFREISLFIIKMARNKAPMSTKMGIRMGHIKISTCKEI
jgi:hypothetical protein